MDISIKCQLSLSKKLRAIIQEGETRITMVCPNITNGRGEAKLIISSDKKINKNQEDFLGKETSIMLIPVEIEDVSVNDSSVSSIFSKTVKTNKTNLKSPIEKLAVIEPPEEKELHYAMKNEEELDEEIPEQFAETKNPDFKRYINTLDELNIEIEKARTKDSNIDIDKIQDKRQRAEALVLKEKSEAIDVDAFVVNDKCANLAINDLGLNLALNTPYNLANISAKRILCSKDLKAMFNANLVKFIKPQEVSLYVQKAVFEMPTLEVYSTTEAAEEGMARAGMKVEALPIDINDLSSPTENEMMVTNLTSRPAVRTQNGTVKTIHGNSQPQRPVPSITTEPKENSKGIKTIRRTT